MTFLFTVVEDVNAQRRGKKKRRVDTEETDDRRRKDSDDMFMAQSFKDKLNYEIKPGNLFFGTTTVISFKANVGYNFNRSISAGIGGKYYYLWFSQGNFPSVSRSDYGGFVYARAKIATQLYLVAEYNLLSLGNFNSDVRGNIDYPAAGIGYITPGLDWSMGAELLIVLNSEAREALELPVEYWLNFSYNF